MNLTRLVKIFDNVLSERYMYNNYDVYVMNSSNTLSSGLLCTSFSDFNGGYKKVDITCDRYPTFLGDQIAIIRSVDKGILQVYELKVYRKLKQRKNKLPGFLHYLFSWSVRLCSKEDLGKGSTLLSNWAVLTTEFKPILLAYVPSL